ncbi:4'-phosphopantetheinyl transferase superfamily protein [Spiroplasma endosymbiont of 'Nebria riversi']|uniref:4'-phosphopantetheinyl transferase superfamily protein n=1 Tax=Spiroplasma endosymbiont of 'Nebria riversi' TaxID=2792084 RepID=UPI001C03C0D4|nr:4'-phosphopantetheinyl transferase superfamily protein [Spiroplasma endosymbiont of 'Nebria riversi']
MIKGVGIDIVSIKRMQLKKSFINKVLHLEEVSYLQTIKSETEKKQFLAGRWALKEALYKAINNVNEVLIFCEVNIQLVNKQLQWIGFENNSWLSISHEKEYAVGMAILTL